MNEPAYLNQDSPSGQYREEALKLGITPGSVAVAVHRLRQRYGEAIHTEIARTVASHAEVEDEYRHLRDLLSGVSLLGSAWVVPQHSGA